MLGGLLVSFAQQCEAFHLKGCGLRMEGFTLNEHDAARGADGHAGRVFVSAKLAFVWRALLPVEQHGAEGACADASAAVGARVMIDDDGAALGAVAAFMAFDAPGFGDGNGIHGARGQAGGVGALPSSRGEIVGELVMAAFSEDQCRYSGFGRIQLRVVHEGAGQLAALAADAFLGINLQPFGHDVLTLPGTGCFVGTLMGRRL